MGRCRAAAVFLAAGGCAAVTGLGDYEITEDPGPDGGFLADTGSMATSSSSGADGSGSSSSSGDAGPDPTDASGDSAPPPPGFDAGVLGVAPDCTRTTCPPETPSTKFECRLDGCATSDGDWNGNAVNNGKANRASGMCTTSAPNATSQGYFERQVPAPTPIQFEAHARVFLDKTATAVLMSVDDEWHLEVRLEKGEIRLCEGESNCTKRVKVDASVGNNIEVYGQVASGGGTAWIGTGTGACTAFASLVLPANPSGSIRARVGCLSAPCELSADDLMLATYRFNQ